MAEALTAGGVALLAVVAFALVLARSHLPSVVHRLAGTAVSGVAAMLDSSLDDDTKERAVRRASIGLLLTAWQLAWRFSLALAAVALPILAADLAGLVSRQSSLGVLMRIDFIVIVSILAITAGWLLGRRARAADGRITDSSAYGAGEMMIHALAFSGPATLRTMAHLDDRLFARSLADVPAKPPVFITSLARGGTTALLNAMHNLPAIATHRYCDMPFISAPMLWSKLAGRRRGITERERAHGDGLTIGLQSPEAFDEIFWQLYWPEKYRETHIDLWKAKDRRSDATEFFTAHFRKIVKLRRPVSAYATAPPVRYLSKNNANIARLELLPVMFPDSDIVVPLREPAAHAASMYRQHRNFSRLHAGDEFALRYMRDIGHFEFGALHRPMAFDRAALESYRPDEPDYWLAYWVAAFEEVGHHASNVHLVTQDDLRAAPDRTMHELLDRLGLDSAGANGFGNSFRSGPDHSPDDAFDPALLRRARDVYASLRADAVR